MQKAKTVVFNPTIGDQGMVFVGARGQKGIQDPYSGKYYGEKSYEQLVAEANTAKSYISQKLQAPTFSMSGSSLDQPYRTGIGILDFGNKNTLTVGQYLTQQLSSIFIPKKEEYVQFDKINQSYNLYGEDWDKFFRANYQNPRIAEEQRNRQARGQQMTDQGRLQASTNTSVSSTVSPRRKTGTGIATSTFNPFGSLEAGLGL
jgi:hypothetical protein